MKMQVIETVVEKIPTEVTEQMASMYSEITSLRTWKEKSEEEYKKLREDFDKMMAYLTEEGKKKIRLDWLLGLGAKKAPTSYTTSPNLKLTVENHNVVLSENTCF